MTLVNGGYYERVGVDIGQGMTLMVPARRYASSDPTAAAGLQRAEEVFGYVAAGVLIVIPGPEDLVIAGAIAAKGIPGITKAFRAANRLHPASAKLIARMNSMCARSGFCDDTAEALLAEAGGIGRVLTVSPGSIGGVIRTPELGRIEAWAYHKVYSDGRYVYDPLLSTDAIPLGDWWKLMRTLNPGAKIR